MKRDFWTLLLALLSLLGGCVSAAARRDAVRVGPLNPRPLIDMTPSQQSLALEVDPGIPDVFVIPEQNGITEVPVEGWRTSLTNGFLNGPARFFGPPGGVGLKLVLVQAMLDYVPTVMMARGAVVGAAAGVARIRYLARLLDAAGVVLGRTSGEVLSTQQWTDIGGSSRTATEAIESMYRGLVAELFRQIPAPIAGASAAAPDASGPPIVPNTSR